MRIRQAFSRLQSPLGLTLVLLAPLATLRILSMATRHLITGHDSFQYLQLQYIFFNEAAVKGALPQWLPFMTQGTVSNQWLITVLDPLLALILPFAPLLKGVNFLYIFQTILLFDEFVLILGCVLLARRYFKSLATVLFVSAGIAYTSITVPQIWYNFHHLYLMPLTLYCLDRVFRDASARHLFLAGLLAAAMFLAALPYYLPVTAFTFFIFGAAVFLYAPREGVANLKALMRRLHWSRLLVLLIPLGFLIIIGIYVKEGYNQIFQMNIGRTESGAISSITEALTYGGYTGWSKFTELISRYSNNIDNTIYGGLLVVPLALVTLARVRSKISSAFGITALVLIFFSVGTYVSVAFFYAFPLGNYFRHIGHITPLMKIFLVFYAGFGFDYLWLHLQEKRHILWRDRTVRDKLTLLIPMMAIILIFAAIVLQRSGILPVFDNTLFQGPTPTQNLLYLDRQDISVRMAWLLALSGVFLIIWYALIRWPKQAMVILSLLLILHVGDVLSLKTEQEYARIKPVSQDVIDLFKSYDYSFAMERNQDYYSNSRFTTLAPYIFVNPTLSVGEKEIFPDGLGRYGALYWNMESFLFFDAGASTFRTDHWQKSIDEFNLAWFPRNQMVLRHLGFPIPDSVAYRKASGFNYPKLQMFSQINVLPDDNQVARILSDTKFSGDMLLASDGDTATSRIISPAVQKSGEILALNADARLSSATITVEEFSFDNLRVKVKSGIEAPSVLYYADAWNPNWRAYVNGIETPVIKTNLGYKSIIIPAGESDVFFKFGDQRNRWLVISLIVLGILAVGAILYLLVADLCRESRKTAPSPVKTEGRRGLVWYNHEMLKRIVIAFGAIYFFWMAFVFNAPKLISTVWSIVRLADPNGVALISVGMTVLATVGALLLTLITIKLDYVWFIRGMVFLGISLDIAGTIGFGLSTSAAWLGLALHLAVLIAVGLLTIRRKIQIAYLLGMIALIAAWFGTAPNIFGFPGEVTALAYDIDSGTYKAYVYEEDGSSYSVLLASQIALGRRALAISELVEEAYFGYNIIHAGERFYGIRQADGPWILGKYLAGGYVDGVDGTSIEQVKKKIDAFAVPNPAAKPETVSELIKAGYQGYDVIRQDGHFYGIRQADGAWSLEKYQSGKYTRAVDGATLEEIKQKIDALTAKPASPAVASELVEQGYWGYNIIRESGRYYGIRQADGAWSLGRFQSGGYTKAVEGATLEEIKQKIDAL